MNFLSAKKWFLPGVLSVIVLTSPLYSNGLVHLLQSNSVYAAEQSTSADKHVISIVGEGEIMVKPDIAYVSLGIQTKAATANEAQSMNAQGFAKLEKVLYEDYKLDQKDVKTSGFQVQPIYSYSDKEPKITGYTTTQMIQVSYRDLDKLGVFLDAASDAGVNQVNGIQFSTEKSEEYESQAIDKAMNNAGVKAKVVAKNAGKELKGIINVTQNGRSGTPIQRENFGPMLSKQDAASTASPTSISTGELKITTTVNVQYEF
jgi:uncharacterized protein YggE